MNRKLYFSLFKLALPSFSFACYLQARDNVYYLFLMDDLVLCIHSVIDFISLNYILLAHIIQCCFAELHQPENSFMQTGLFYVT